MNIVLLAQGSQAWLDYRLKMRNASETAAVLGESPWMTPYQLWLLKTGRSTTKATAAMQHGTDMEPAARAAY
jgi:predicted phage-related endonuclease